MQRPRIVITGVALALAAGISGVAAAAATSSGGHKASQSAATVHTVTASVDGQDEQILVDARGLPLYYYRPDTATASNADFGIARLWPPLTSAHPSARGLQEALTVVHDTYGDQVAYRGHLLYTFVSDRSGRVTGQGVQDFFVATPALARLAGAVAPPSSASPARHNGYGY